MNRLLLSILLLASFCYHGYCPVVIGPITPSDPADTYPVFSTHFQQGGAQTWMTNSTQLTNALNTVGIPPERRDPWMTSTINGVTYQLDAGLVNWSPIGPNLLVPQFSAVVSQITFPIAGQFIQRTGSSTTFSVTGYAAGPTATAVEARFNGGSWTSMGGTDYYGYWSNNITAPTSQGILEARVVGTTSVVAVTPVSVGDIFAIWGQSNGSGRGANNQISTNHVPQSYIFGNDYVWRQILDPTDSDLGQLDSISDDLDPNGMGSVWPRVSDIIGSTTGTPTAFVQCTKGATGFNGTAPTSWLPGTDHFDRTTLYGSGMYRIRAVGGVRAILWWQGEGGGDDPLSYTVPFSQMAAAIGSDFPGLKIIPAKLEQDKLDNTGALDTRQTNWWYAVGLLWATNANTLHGPVLADVPIGDPGNILAEPEGLGTVPWYHLKSNGAQDEAARRWATNIMTLFP